MMYAKWAQAVFIMIIASAVALSGFTDNPVSQTSIEWPGESGTEQNSPGDHVTEDQIHVYQDKVVIELDNAKWAKFTDTNSMDPVIDEDSNAIQIVPHHSDQIEIGDIISYTFGNRTIIHRVYDIGFDDNGWYAITKGDNLKEPDTEPVRFEQVTKLVVGIIY